MVALELLAARQCQSGTLLVGRRSGQRVRPRDPARGTRIAVKQPPCQPAVIALRQTDEISYGKLISKVLITGFFSFDVVRIMRTRAAYVPPMLTSTRQIQLKQTRSRMLAGPNQPPEHARPRHPRLRSRTRPPPAFVPPIFPRDVAVTSLDMRESKGRS